MGRLMACLLKVVHRELHLLALVQAVEACSTGKAAAVQTGTACEDRDAEAEGVIHITNGLRMC